MRLGYAPASKPSSSGYLPAYLSIAVDSTPRSPSACYPATANIRLCLLVLLLASQQPETISLNLQSQALFLPPQMEERSLQPPPIQFFDARNLRGTSTSYRKPDIRPRRYEPPSKSRDKPFLSEPMQSSLSSSSAASALTPISSTPHISYSRGNDTTNQLGFHISKLGSKAINDSKKSLMRRRARNTPINQMVHHFRIHSWSQRLYSSCRC